MAAGAGAGPVTSLAVEPTELVLVGATNGAFMIRNPTEHPIPLKASIGNYAIKKNGTVVVNPRVAPKGSAKQWLTIAPKSFTLKPHTSAQLKVRSHPGRRAGPGDHHALVLLATVPSGKSRVLVKTRVAVAVLVRVSGKIKREFVIGGLSAARRRHQLRLVVKNAGNINERLPVRSVTVAIKHGRRVVQTLRAPARDILPHSGTVYRLPYRSSLKGKMTATVTVRPLNGSAAGPLAPPLKPVKKTFRVRF